MNRSRIAGPAAVMALIFALSGLAAGSPRTRASDSGALASEIHSLLSRTYPPDRPGAVALVIQDGEVLLREAFGRADMELEVPLAPDMVFPCGSMTKMFTAAAVMMLAEEGKLNYSTPVSQYFPEATPAWSGVMIDHLLSHTSGIVDLFMIPEWMAQWKEEVSPQALIAFFKDKPLRFEPGAKAEYCNSNYVLLGQIVEKVSGQTLDQFVTERIIARLGLKSTRFAVKLEDIIPRLVKGYLLTPGALQNAPFLIPWSQAYGVGTVHSTVDEVARFAAALLDGTLLKPGSVAMITTPRTLKDGKRSPYGYGNLFVFTDGLAPMVRISGSTSTTQVCSLTLRDKKASVLVFSNVTSHDPNTDNPYHPVPMAKKIALMLAKAN